MRPFFGTLMGTTHLQSVKTTVWPKAQKIFKCFVQNYWKTRLANAFKKS